ncbi:DUF2971 domain-containing protein [Ruminococcaceae bacterium OttesenSCG-928-A16]|nr:DUF2971 domain-containing protein [Ruminococcaceae bacterium OttesenSCG-928-A16]
MVATKSSKAEKPEELVYHYCSLETFYSIVTNHTVRLSEIDKSNDRKEIIWIKDFIQHAFTQQFEATASAELLEKLPTLAFAKLLEATLEDFFGKSTWYNYLGCCFSKKEDLLSQWRGYADNGAGVCLGFSKRQLEELSEQKQQAFMVEEKLAYPLRWPSHGDVMYIEMGDYRAEGTTARYTGWLKELAKNLVASLEDEDGYRQEEKRMYGADILGGVVAAFLQSPLYKSKGFAEEEEWRILSLIEKTRELPGATAGLAQDAAGCGSIVRGRNFVFYTDWKFAPAQKNKDATDMIQEVILGPKCKACPQDISLFMRANNHLIAAKDIVLSKISYR